jgi:hypothetical protein
MRGHALWFVVAVSLLGCSSPYSGQAEPLVYPKKKEVKSTSTVQACPPEPDTCKTAFDLKPSYPTAAAKSRQSHSLAQDADNKMDGYAAASCVDRKKKAYNAVTILSDALRTDPYSPLATYTLASVYAQVGKKKCAQAMLMRLNELSKQTDLQATVTELKTREKTDSSFDGMRKEADGALEGK